MARPEFLLISTLILAVTTYLIYKWMQIGKKLRAIIDTPTSQCSSLINSHSHDGKQVEVKGMAVPANAVTQARFSNCPCVYFHSLEQEHIREVSRSYSSSRGRGGTRVRRYYRTVGEFKSNTLFFLEDGSGAVQIDPVNAEVECEQVFNTYVPTGAGGGFFGNMFAPYGPTIIGVVRKEWAIKPNQNIYVIGTLFKRGDSAMIGSDPGNDNTFLISTKSEEEIIASGRRWQLLYLIGWVLLSPVGLYLLFASFIAP